MHFACWRKMPQYIIFQIPSPWGQKFIYTELLRGGKGAAWLDFCSWNKSLYARLQVSPLAGRGGSWYLSPQTKKVYLEHPHHRSTKDPLTVTVSWKCRVSSGELDSHWSPGFRSWRAGSQPLLPPPELPANCHSANWWISSKGHFLCVHDLQATITLDIRCFPIWGFF